MGVDARHHPSAPRLPASPSARAVPAVLRLRLGISYANTDDLNTWSQSKLLQVYVYIIKKDRSVY